MSAERAPRIEYSSAKLMFAGPFDLALSLKAAASFLPAIEPASTALRTGMYVRGQPAIVEIRQSGRRIDARGPVFIGERALRDIATRLVNAELDLDPFNRLCAGHPVMGPVVKSLYGLKPLRPASLFEMLVIAITEQQLSLAAAFHIRRRLVERFGSWIDGVWLFPAPAALAGAPLPRLQECGLSGRKAEYVADLAGAIVARRLDVSALKAMSDDEVREVLARQRGLGEWSIEYFLARGLGRLDCLPAGDVGLRRVGGCYLAAGARLSPEELTTALTPFAPYRGLAAYYLAVHARLFPAVRAAEHTARIAEVPS